MSAGPIELIVPEENNLERVDKFLPLALEQDLSRSYVQKLIHGGSITVNEKTIKPNYKVKTDDRIVVVIPEPEPLALEPEDIPLDIVYQDRSIAVVNKQAGLVVHPGPGNWNRTMVNGLLYHIKDLSTIGGVARPGIVHRLDKDTAGLMVVAKDDASHQFLTAEFSERRVRKKYVALVVGKPKTAHGLIDLPIGRHRKYRHKMTVDENGREALTEYTVSRVLNSRLGVFTILDIDLHTGRTHQIRVHLSSAGIPIVGDPIYSKKWEKYRVPYLLLASVRLEFTHPATGETVSFAAEPPAHMQKFIEKAERLSV
ncbi:MAG TPA: RluA family pseudouridine synthase [Spirochaetota bacterium]|nr:RluA family pseudouridine synthase [Spirochaetota bacterium]HPC41983.1 RluA family pseudouridine synthase [Spirochaetota bacterium]HPL17243.1 RluA family pseudouridine synthase [Spirochaetota bacterium]HQF06971.1 RluA family pseudouridine synthase [Spirochaetota bacterium]HQH95708.1 RluA family pseudouridine synthase [Spirochaetota bacterium]